MKTGIYLLGLPLALISCAQKPAPTPVTTTASVTHEVTTAGPGGAEVLVTKPPPRPRSERQPVAPDPDDVWVAGHWRWIGTRYVWVGGKWVARPKPTATWVAGHWVRRPGGWVWIAGRWQ